MKQKSSRTHMALQNNEALLADIFESIHDGISVLDTNMHIVRVNGVMEEWYKENLPLTGRKCFSCYHNTDKPCDPCPALRSLKSGEPETDIVPGLPGSAIEWLELFSYPIKDHETGTVNGVVEFVRDITARKKAEVQLQTSLREKDLLLQEVHHRTKNNLQVILSLLNIQSRTIEDEAARKVFESSCVRVHSMALVHEELYRSDDFNSISLQKYIDKMLLNISIAYKHLEHDIRVTADMGDLVCSVDQAVPLGLILNELLTNAYKHAFMPGHEGECAVTVNGRVLPDGGFEISVSDTGAGIPADVNPETSSSLGMKLVYLLADQLQAQVQLDGNDGTMVVLTIGTNEVEE